MIYKKFYRLLADNFGAGESGPLSLAFDPEIFFPLSLTYFWLDWPALHLISCILTFFFHNRTPYLYGCGYISIQMRFLQILLLRIYNFKNHIKMRKNVYNLKLIKNKVIFTLLRCQTQLKNRRANFPNYKIDIFGFDKSHCQIY